jgi:hypothetical protein
VRIAYLDESGTPELSGSTTHLVLVALVIPGHTWKAKDQEILAIKQEFGLDQRELHAAWLSRRYVEQEHIAGFAGLSYADRTKAVEAAREVWLLKRAALKGVASLRELKKNLAKTAPYVHLTHAERREVLRRVAEAVGRWTDAVLFAECIDKQALSRAGTTPPFEEAFDQVVTRFHRYLTRQRPQEYGLLVQDQNDTVSERLTTLMRQFHQRGTRWTGQIPLLVETPLFVDSRLTSMVQVADLCSYALRRYVENAEQQLFDLVYSRGDCHQGRCVGIRHYRGGKACSCTICVNH